jgi:regulator of replication initiation timing
VNTTYYPQCMTEDKLRDEAQRLMEEKEEYQEIAKDTLKKLVDEKLEAVKKMQEVEKNLSNTEDEFAVMKEMYDRNLEENQNLAVEVTRVREELETVKKELPPPKTEEEEAVEAAAKQQEEMEAVAESDVTSNTESAINVTSHEEEDSEQQEDSTEAAEAEVKSTDTTISEAAAVGPADDTEKADDAIKSTADSFTEPTPALLRDGEDFQEVKAKLWEMEQREEALQAELKRCREEWEAERQRLEKPSKPQVKNDETAREENDGLEELKCSLDESRIRNDRLEEELRLEREKTRRQLEENRLSLSTATLKEDEEEEQESLLDTSLNDSLHEAEAKIAELLKVKERFADVAQDKSRLETSVAELEREVETLGFQSQTATACAVVPIFLLIMAIVMAYMPMLASLFGTADNV